MPTSRIVMRPARNPRAKSVDGDDHRGYTLIAPPTYDGHLDEGAITSGECAVRRFAPD